MKAYESLMSDRLADGQVGAIRRVVAPARLHFALFNESGANGRVDGGAGVAVASPRWDITLSKVVGVPARRDAPPPVSRIVGKLCEYYGYPACQVKIARAIPSHVGLGSHTALAMAIARGYCALHGIDDDYINWARAVRRGGTSGVGVHVSQYGGFVVDGGREFPAEKSSFGPSSLELADPPALVARGETPPSLRMIHFRLGRRGLSGKDEAKFFRESTPVPTMETYEILRLVETYLIPGIEQQDIGLIDEILSELQGLGLKRLEWEIQDRATQDLRDVWSDVRRRNPRLPSLCLSSMGPTTFMLTDAPEETVRILRGLGIRRFMVTGAVRGARVSHV